MCAATCTRPPGCSATSPPPGRATDDLAAALGAEVGGTIDAATWTWTCSCGASATETSEHTATLGLYFHRRADHRAVAVTVPACPDSCDEPTHFDWCPDCGAWIHTGEPWTAHRIGHEQIHPD